MKIYVYEYKYRPKLFINNSLYILIDIESVQCVENISGFISDRLSHSITLDERYVLLPWYHGRCNTCRPMATITFYCLSI